MASPEDKEFNDTLKRMLETPPKPHEPKREDEKPPPKKKAAKRKTKKKGPG